LKILIDTHALIWFCEGNKSLSEKAHNAMLDETIEKYISPAVPWEMAIKIANGKLKTSVDFSSIFPGVVDSNGFILMPIQFQHIHKLLGMANHHADPFDRIMIAQAMAEGCTVATTDPNFSKYALNTLW
jgi:PIN domain nuclease of toxin-antitoxin system